MATYKVVFEIHVEAENSFEAAKTVQDWLQDDYDNWQYYVQNEETNQIDSVDLAEHNSVAVVENVLYSPLIK